MPERPSKPSFQPMVDAAPTADAAPSPASPPAAAAAAPQPRERAPWRAVRRHLALLRRNASVAPAQPQAPRDALARHATALAAALPHELTEGNQVEVLVDGPATYAAMFQAIDAARDHINIESYIVEAEGPGRELARRLIAKRREGVKVNLLFDHFGSLQTRSSYFDALREAGVQMCCYNPLLRGFKETFRRAMHLRDHRKLLIVDGRVAFTGGINISNVYAVRPGAGRRPWQAQPAPWRDTHVKVQGPVVAQLQQLFIDHWISQTGQRPYLAHYFPRLPKMGPHRVGVAACEAGRRRNPFYRSLLRAIELAQHRICITAAYFVPPRRLLRALCQAAQRGVRVELLLPSMSDAWAPLHAGRSHYSRLLRSGVHIHERLDALLHAKTAVIDGVWATVGSSNLDWRSFLHNAEANVVVLGEAFAARLEQVFADDLARSEAIALEDWRRRGRRQRLLEWAARKVEFFL
ncbi:phospholipase D-like domain-containing protein [Ideonella sp. BN130291]|uniref:phospholipase D-like domain-containing protein n=1 Tax=Ideonella sp. BN130291 TaxID=3112940 RepID=UPI002E263192|nr:phospholipase D-like domain-containing protein [Ideonella sp. BN130291]